MPAVIDTPKFTELLLALEGTDNQKRQQAEALYQQARKAEPANVIPNLLAVLATDSIGESCRMQAAVLLRQCVQPCEGDAYGFAHVPQNEKQEIASVLLQRFEAEQSVTLQKKVGDIIAAVVEGAWDPKDQRGWIFPQPGWPAFLQLIIQMANPSANANVESVHSSIMLLKALVPSLQHEVVSAQQQIGSILQNGLGHSTPKIQCATTLLVCEMVATLPKKDWAPLMVAAAPVLEVMRGFAQNALTKELESCIQGFTVVAEVEPDFFKAQLSSSMQPAQFFSELVKSHAGVEKGIRQLALEWLTTFAEKKPKWITKNLAGFGPIAIECCMALMLEISDDPSELKAWTERMDDEEGEEDMDELYQVGSECIDRFVEAVGMDFAGTHVIQAVARFTQQDAWQAKLSALTAVKQTVEYVEEPEHVNEMAKLLLQHMDHPHPRVRYIALHALGQLAHDQAPTFQETWHKTCIPVFLTKMDDAVDRVASMAMSSFVCFAEELDKTILLENVQTLMQKLVSKLQSTNHRMVQEECITAIAVIAGVIEEDFCQYYDGMMPLLKAFIMNSTAENQHRLRGKAFECMSLLGVAVGKEKFLPDAQVAVGELLKTSQTLESDDPQREYIHEASERICKCLKRDFAQFVPHLLPDVLKRLNIAELGQDASVAAGQDDEDDIITVNTGDGKLVKVHSSKFEEIALSLKMLRTFCEDMEGAFYDYVPTVAQALVQIISAKDEESVLCDDARGGAFQTWAALIKVAHDGGKERGQDFKLVNELLRTSLRYIITLMQEEDDAEVRDMCASSLADCLRNAGPGLLTGSEVLQLVRQLFTFISESLQRSNLVEKAVKESKKSAPAELQDEDDGDMIEQDEKALRVSLQEAIGATMETNATEFTQCLPECSVHMTQWLQDAQNKTLAIFLACDLVKHLKEHSQPLWPVFMPAVFQALRDKDVDVRIPAAYLVNLAAPLPDFGEASPETFKLLANIVTAPAPKKRDERAKIAIENAVAALLMLARHQGAHCPPEIPAWLLVVQKLPLKEDDAEAKVVHGVIVDLVIEQHAGLLGNDNAHLGKILSSLAEVYKQEDVCSKETDEKILRIFQLLPQSVLSQVASSFTEKQQKRVESMLSKSGA